MKGKAKKSDVYLLFGKIARKHQFVLPDDLDECLIIQQKLRLMGGKLRLGEVLMDQGYLTNEHVMWILKRQFGSGRDLPEDATQFGALATVNGFIARIAVDRALKTQRKAAKKGENLRIGEILVAGGEMTPPERDAILMLQKRIRGVKDGADREEGSAKVLLLEEERVRKRRWRPIVAALLMGAVLAVLAVLLAFAILQ
jgi:hypothetical protein